MHRMRLTWLSRTYGIAEGRFTECCTGLQNSSGLASSKTLTHRFVAQNVPVLVPISEFARAAGLQHRLSTQLFTSRASSQESIFAQAVGH